MSTIPDTPPVLGFVAWSGTGKTSLLTQILPLLGKQGLKVGLIKHAHHSFDIDYPGKDSFELRKAGAGQVIVASRARWAMITETPDMPGDPHLSHLLTRLNDDLDMVLVEGFKHVSFPKIEVHRPSLGKALMFPDDPDIIAVVSDGPLDEPTDLPILDINNPLQVAGYVVEWLRRQS
jgi:molybdopterin-guanine dinucleotide biosynthesis protein MobB